MNKKTFWIIVPISLLPYLILFVLATIFFSTKFSFFHFIMESVFQNNALNLLTFLLIYGILIMLFSFICFIVSIYKKWDAVSLVEMAVIMKLIQVPAYIVIFIVGVLFSITIFTIPFSIGLFLCDCISVFLTGIWVISSAIITIRQGVFKMKEVRWVIILQFIFCADVISSIIFYLKLKRFYSESHMQKQNGNIMECLS